MKRIVLASKNMGKLREIQSLLKGKADLVGLNEFPEIPEIVEDGNTFFENALKKAQYVSEKTGEISLADDSGLEIDILNGKPGIYSARYSGPNATDQTNIEKILIELEGIGAADRKARFRCVLVLYYPEGRYDTFDGTLEGMITETPKGAQGFGYDPIFFVPGFEKTVAEMPLELKNQISHRAQALKKLMEKLSLNRV